MASQKYQRDSRGLLAQARGELAQGDLRQAEVVIASAARQSRWRR